jgi:hypothetical protein
MSLELQEFDAKCKKLVEKQRALKELEKEVKELKRGVLDILLTRDEDDQKYHAAGATIYVREELYPKLPQDLMQKSVTMKHLHTKDEHWYRRNLTFNARAFKSWCDAERNACAEQGEEWQGVPNVEFNMTQSLGIKGG